MLAAQDFSEYCAALTASATYNVNRKKDTKFITPDTLMWRSQSRMRRASPVVELPVRYATPGERPPSRKPAGPDNVIDKFDVYMRNRRGGTRG